MWLMFIEQWSEQILQYFKPLFTFFITDPLCKSLSRRVCGQMNMLGFVVDSYQLTCLHLILLGSSLVSIVLEKCIC